MASYLKNVDLSSVNSSDIRVRAISLEMHQPSINDFSLDIMFKISLKSPRGNELTSVMYWSVHKGSM